MNIDFIISNLLEKKDAIAVASEGMEYKFLDIYEEYLRIRDLLQKQKFQSGTVVAVRAEFCPRSIACILALIELDAIFVPISFLIKNAEKYVPISQCQYIIDVMDDVTIRKTEYKVENPLLQALIAKKVPGLVLFSSGTTGEPKAALHDMTYLLEKYKKKGKSLRTVSFLLFDHIGGFNTMMHTLANGNFIATLKTRSPEEVCNIIEKYQIELLPTSPSFLNMILLSRAYEKYDMSSLKMISYGTEPMPESTLCRLHECFPSVTLKQTYGLSEIGIMATKSENSSSLWMKLGGDGYETKIVDDILYIRSKSTMIGYLNAPLPIDEEGWFNTKDKVECKGGYIKILGRTTDLINVGGEKVYPNEVESMLLAFDGVKDVYVYGKDNPIMGKCIVADVYVEEQNNNREFIKKIRKYCKESLESFKRPTTFNLTNESFCCTRFKKKRE